MRKPLAVFQRFWAKSNKFHETVRGQCGSFTLGSFWKKVLSLFALNGCKWQWFGKKKYILIAKSGRNVNVRAEGTVLVIHQNNGTMCEFQNEDTISIYFDGVEHCLTKPGQKQDIGGISKTNVQVMLQEWRFEICVMRGTKTGHTAEQNNKNNKKKLMINTLHRLQVKEHFQLVLSFSF